MFVCIEMFWRRVIEQELGYLRPLLIQSLQMSFISASTLLCLRIYKQELIVHYPHSIQLLRRDITTEIELICI